MLGLRQEIGGDPGGIVVPVGEDEDLGRAGDHVDADPAEDAPLGRGDVGIARSHDLVDRRNRRGAVGKGGDRLRAADPIDLGDPEHLGGGKNERVENPVRRRHRHDQPLDPGDLGRDRVHQHRGGVGRRAARHIKPDRFDRPPTLAEPHPERVDIIDARR